MFPLLVDSGDQGQSVRPVLAIDHSEIETLAARAEEFQDIACVVSDVTEASRFQKNLSQAFFKMWIVR